MIVLDIVVMRGGDYLVLSINQGSVHMAFYVMWLHISITLFALT